MKRSTFTDEQILAIVREGEAGRRVADLCRSILNGCNLNDALSQNCVRHPLKPWSGKQYDPTPHMPTMQLAHANGE